MIDGSGGMSHETLEPLPYHVELRDYLKLRERDLWDWFASARAQADYTENLRLSLLKSTYRLDAESHAELYRAVDQAKAKLRLEIPVTLYQAQNTSGLNATLYFIPGEGHLVFSGPILNLLNGDEIKSVIGHELAHYHLWEWQQGELHIADRLLQAVAQDPRAADSHELTARRFQLYTEIYADRGALMVAEDVHHVVASLVKVETGLAQVSATSYLKQADEIFAQGKVATQGLSHPESFIRARAVSLWRQDPSASQEQIVEMIEGPEAFDELDLPGQLRLMGRTRRLLEQFLRPKWLQTPAVLGHAKMFFSDFRTVADSDGELLNALKTSDTKLGEYWCYLLLDFVTADPDLDQMPLVAALEFSRLLELDGQFEKIAAKELKLKLRDVRKLKEQAAELLAKTEASA